MSANKKNHKKDFGRAPFQGNDIFGLEAFKLKIEKDFYCNVAVLNNDEDSENLIIETKFNFDIAFGLSLLADQKIGKLNLSSQKENYLFFEAFEKVRNTNSKSIDIDELNLVFTDCTIIINKIFENSIAIQLQELIVKLNENILFFTRGFNKMPLEIHVPVFEEKIFQEDCNLLSLGLNKENIGEYYTFWALYFEDQIEADIYDFKNKQIINGELTMINH
ncbi:hypothetical protein KO500_06420 [Cellulophaga baltica]|uniref:hypothetical protein n=1 Tax=Cellulophaga TaxID=104264 RepID=UPI001C072722|nr:MULTISPECIES: hypothetical protein [Cellulophaga]MBU2996059.1 hypothetical protein [Cellulophaga baltica]MDO6767454.1 hypothetical protein [Cellulophaga sp. 1_MG-2023]